MTCLSCPIASRIIDTREDVRRPEGAKPSASRTGRAVRSSQVARTGSQPPPPSCILRGRGSDPERRPASRHSKVATSPNRDASRPREVEPSRRRLASPSVEVPTSERDVGQPDQSPAGAAGLSPPASPIAAGTTPRRRARRLRGSAPPARHRPEQLLRQLRAPRVIRIGVRRDANHEHPQRRQERVERLAQRRQRRLRRACGQLLSRSRS